jgi:anthranilate synthase component 1
MTQETFEAMVCEAKEHIAAGDIFQVVLSQRFTRETSVEAFDVYRAVRRLNPSPYMFFFDFGLVDDETLFIVGSSPEMFVRLEGRTATDRRDTPPRSRLQCRRVARQRAARRPEGTRRACDAGGPRAQ